MKTARLSAGDWVVGPVYLAESFLDRLVGFRHRAAAEGVLMPTTLLHTIGLQAAIIAVSLDDERKVVEVRRVPPNRFVWFRNARSVVELPERGEPPKVGELVEILHV